MRAIYFLALVLLVPFFGKNLFKVWGNECKLLVNEINADSPTDIKKTDFLEFVSYCNGVKKGISLQGYKVIGITTGTIGASQMSIVLVMNLWNNKTNENGLLTVGGVEVPNADSYAPNPSVHYRNEFLPYQKHYSVF